MRKKVKLLMVGPGRKVMGGISTVVNSYYVLGLDQQVDLKYIASMQDGIKIKKLLVAMIAYTKFCKDIQYYDVVHVHMAAQASFTRKSFFIKKARQAGKKIIIHQHAADFDIFFLKQCTENKREKIREVFGMADKIIVLSEEWANFFASYICERDKICIIHNGVVLPNYQKMDYEDHNVLFLGRLGQRKGIYDLIKAIPRVVEKVPDVRFYFGGDGDVEHCKQIASMSGFSEYIEFLGWVKNEAKESYFKKCSTFILPSYHEGMPMSVLEAMSYGLATISTNAGGIPQIITHGVDGYRIEAGNVDAIVESLLSVLLDKSVRIKLGIAGKQKINERFSADKNISTLVELYRKVDKENDSY